MEKVVSNKNNIDNIKASKENFAQLLEESFSREAKKVGGLVKGTVVAIEKDTVLVDIGFKSEGRVPIKEFTSPDKRPELGDLIVFKTPADNRTDYIKRLIGKEGDEIQFVDGDLFINGSKVIREKIKISEPIRCGNFILETNNFVETLPNGVKYLASYNKQGTLKNTKKYIVPKDHLFLMGDNRDCSKDSRFLDDVGYVNNLNLVGKAKIIFFSNDTKNGSLLKFWNLQNSFRFKRTFQKLK